jgi:hypothetical protein
MAKETKQSSATWQCKCVPPRELPVRIVFCSRCGTGQPGAKR